MRCAILGFTAGVLALQSSATLPSTAWMLTCTVCVIACIALASRLKQPWSATSATAAGLLLGYTWAALLAHHALASELALRDEGRDLTVVGIVDSLPYRFEQGLRFNLLVERTETPGTTVPPRIALSWYADRYGSRQGGLPDKLMPGERWRLTVRLQRPHGNANPGGFDYEAWLLEQGVRATGYVRVDDATPGSTLSCPASGPWSSAAAPFCASAFRLP